MEPRDTFENPLEPLSSYAHPAVMMGVGFGMDYWASKVINDQLTEYAGLKVGKDFVKNRKAHPSFTGNRLATQAELLRRYDAINAGDTKTHAARRILRGSETKADAEMGRVRKLLRKWIDSPEVKRQKLMLRQAAYSPELINSIEDVKLKASLAQAGKFRAIGIASISIGMASLGYSLAEGALGALATKGRSTRQLNRTAMVENTFFDNRMAYTSRQRAMRAIQNSQGGYHRALGNEATYLATMR